MRPQDLWLTIIHFKPIFTIKNVSFRNSVKVCGQSEGYHICLYVLSCFSFCAKLWRKLPVRFAFDRC